MNQSEIDKLMAQRKELMEKQKEIDQKIKKAESDKCAEAEKRNSEFIESLTDEQKSSFCRLWNMNVHRALMNILSTDTANMSLTSAAAKNA